MMPKIKSENRQTFHTVQLAELLNKNTQLVPDGVWLQLKPQPSDKLQLSTYKMSPAYQLGEELKLELERKYFLDDGQSVLLQPAQFFQLTGTARGEAEFSSIPNLYFNKKFNGSNGLGQAHSEVAYFKSYYSHLHPQFGQRPLQVLDLGCGRGRNAVIFAGDREQDYRVMGLDQNSQSLAVWESMSQAEEFGDKLVAELADLNTWRAAPPHDIAMAIVSLQFLRAQAAGELLCHCMEQAVSGALHLAVFPIVTPNSAAVWPGGFHFVPQSNEVKHLYMRQGWSILEYRENYGHLGKIAADGLPVRGLFATLIAQKAAAIFQSE